MNVEIKTVWLLRSYNFFSPLGGTPRLSQLLHTNKWENCLSLRCLNPLSARRSSAPVGWNARPLKPLQLNQPFPATPRSSPPFWRTVFIYFISGTWVELIRNSLYSDAFVFSILMIWPLCEVFVLCFYLRVNCELFVQLCLNSYCLVDQQCLGWLPVTVTQPRVITVSRHLSWVAGRRREPFSVVFYYTYKSFLGAKG